jgi:hypothetical protein
VRVACVAEPGVCVCVWTQWARRRPER